MRANTSPNSKMGKVLAITLLTNSNLGKTTHQAAKIQLINAAKAREPEDSYIGQPRVKCNLIGADCADLREVNTKIVLAMDGLDAAINVSGVEGNI